MKAGPSTLTSTLQVVDPPHELAWTGTTMGSILSHLKAEAERRAATA